MNSSTSNLVIVRGGIASGKVTYAKQLAEKDGRVVIDVDLFRVRGESDAVQAAHDHLQAGRKVVVADTLALKSDIDRFAALSPDAVVLEMSYGQLPEIWEAYPGAIPVKLD